MLRSWNLLITGTWYRYVPGPRKIILAPELCFTGTFFPQAGFSVTPREKRKSSSSHSNNPKAERLRKYSEDR